MKSNFNPQKIKARNSYTFAEISNIFGIHVRTVQCWKKQGLKVIHEKIRPYLVYGEDCRTFLREKRKKKKTKLLPGEFFCTKCKGARKSADNVLKTEFTSKKLGKYALMVFIKGNCEICNTVLTRFSSDKIIMEMLKSGTLIMAQGKGLTGNEYTALNTDIGNESRNMNYQYLELIRKAE